MHELRRIGEGFETAEVRARRIVEVEEEQLVPLVAAGVHRQHAPPASPGR